MRKPASTSDITRIPAFRMNEAKLYRFAAEAQDYHLPNSTIDSVAKVHGQITKHQPKKSPNRWKTACLVSRYSLPPSDRELAHWVLVRLEN
ncbi:hypothetical protein DQ405_026895 [Pseudomonas sp. SST3]|nr:hypothetical protein [Pseudomonas sp. SST3]